MVVLLQVFPLCSVALVLTLNLLILTHEINGDMARLAAPLLWGYASASSMGDLCWASFLAICLALTASELICHRICLLLTP